MKKLAFAAAVVAAISVPGIADASLFRSVGLGSAGEDVRELQRILNADPNTVIALSGPGSPGSESAYFGALTRKAVIKFQIKHGITGTGFVGPITMAKINSMASSKPISANPTNPATSTPSNGGVPSQYIVSEADKIDIYSTDKVLSANQAKLWNMINSTVSGSTKPDFSGIVNVPISSVTKTYITKMSVSVAKPGDTVTLAGYGFSSHASIYIGPTYRVKATYAFGALQFKVPAVPLGRYDIAVKDSGGISQTAVLVVTQNGKSGTKLGIPEPENASFGETITIRGEGFSPSNNEIRTSYGRIAGLPSPDGKRISLRVEPEFLRETVKQKTFNKLYRVEFIVVNSNGVTEPGYFTIRY